MTARILTTTLKSVDGGFHVEMQMGDAADLESPLSLNILAKIVTQDQCPRLQQAQLAVLALVRDAIDAESGLLIETLRQNPR